MKNSVLDFMFVESTSKDDIIQTRLIFTAAALDIIVKRYIPAEVLERIAVDQIEIEEDYDDDEEYDEDDDDEYEEGERYISFTGDPDQFDMADLTIDEEDINALAKMFTRHLIAETFVNDILGMKYDEIYIETNEYEEVEVHMLLHREKK